MRLSATVLGEVHVLADEAVVDLGGARQRRLLAALLVHRGRAVATDDLVEATFGDDPPDAAWRTFRTYVARLRRALDAEGVDGSAVILTTPSGYATCADLALDADRFEALLRSGQDHLDAGEPATAVSMIEEALALWAGPAYGEFAGDDWARPDAVRLEELRLVARELRAAAMVESGRHDEAIAEIRGLIEIAPLREEPRRLLMLGLYRSGRHAEALRAGRDFRAALAEETGLEWSSRLAEVEQMIIDRDPRLDAAPSGRKLRGYVLGETLAETDHGVTYRASQPAVGRDVAITVIPPELADDASFIRRFERHAQRIATIEHPNVVPLYDFWREPGGAYLVTRYMVGGSLATRLETRAAMSPDDVARIVTEVGEALEASAERGVAHGRLTPATVLFDEGGRAHLAGFAVDEIDDAVQRDVAAYAELAGLLWDRVSTPVGVDGDSAAPDVAGVRRVVARARREPAGFGGIRGLADALLAAARGDELHDESLVDPSATIEGPNPYRGLQAFGETDVDVFFGRRAIVDQLAGDLRRDAFVALIGPSGSGKSSVARAGLLPVLRDSGVFVATMVPGAHPVAELEIALSRVATTPVPELTSILDQPGGLRALLAEVLPDESHLVLLIDQLEEAVTMSDRDERDLVFAALAREVREPDSPVQVVVTARADFLGRILEHAVVGPLVRDHSRLVTPLDSDELYEAIVEPAGAAGVAVEPELATALVADAIDSPGSLPLLQFALTELYEHRTDGTMTLDAYRRMGGLAAPIAQRAEEVFSSLTTDEQDATRRLFGRLITLGESAEDTRRRVVRSELATVPQSVLDVFGAARLLTFDRDPRTREPTVEIAHEALIRRWPRLRSWLDDDRADLLVLRHLTSSAASWEAADRDASELYRGSRLATAEEWAQRNEEEMTPQEREFLDAGRSERDRELERDRRRARRLRALAAGLAVVAVTAVVAGMIALIQRDRAQDAATAAEASATEARRQTILTNIERLTAEAQAVLDEDPNLPILLALEAYEQAAELGVDPPGDLITTMQTVVQASRSLYEWPELAGVGAISPDGRNVAAVLGDDRGTMVLIDTDTSAELGRLETGGSIDHVAYAADGERIAVAVNPDENGAGAASDASAASTALVVDIDSLDVVKTLEVQGCCLVDAGLSPDGGLLSAVLWDLAFRGDPTTYVWQLDRPGDRPIVHENADVAGWMPADRTIALFEPGDGLVRFVDALTSEERGPEMRVPGAVWIDVHPDGERLVVVREDVEIWPVGGTEPEATYERLNATVTHGADYSPHGDYIVQFGNDPRVSIIAVGSGEETSLDGHRGEVWDVSLSDDGSKLLAVGDGAILWDLTPEGPDELGNLPSSGVVATLRVSSDVAIVGEIHPEDPGIGERLRSFDLATGVETGSTDVPSAPNGSFLRVVASDNGLVASSGDGATRSAVVVRHADGSTVTELSACDGVSAIDDQGRWLASTFLAGPCEPFAGRIIDPTTGDVVVVLEGREIGLASFGPSGTPADGLFVAQSVPLASPGVLPNLDVYRLPGGELVGSLAPNGRDFWKPRYSADGRYITAGGGGSGGYAISVEQLLAGESMEDAIVLNPSGAGGTFPDVGHGWFIAGESGEVLRFHDLETGVEEMTLPVDTGRSTVTRVTPDGRYLYYVDSRGVLRRFPLDHKELAELARARVQRDFSVEECERFSIADDCSVYEPVATS